LNTNVVMVPVESLLAPEAAGAGALAGGLDAAPLSLSGRPAMTYTAANAASADSAATQSCLVSGFPGFGALSFMSFLSPRSDR
jgi:hypothetical protein